MGPAMPTCQGVNAPSSPNFLGTHYVCPNSLTYSHEIWYCNTWGSSMFMGPSVSKIFETPTYAKIAWPTAIDKIWHGNTWGSSMFPVGQPHSILRGWGSSVHIFFGTPTYVQTVWHRVHVSMASAMPRSQAVGPQHPPDFGDLLHACTQFEKQQTSFMWWSNRDEVNIYTVDHKCWCVISLR